MERIMIDNTHIVFQHKHICLVEDHYNPLGIVRSLGEVGIKPIVILCSQKPYLVNKSKYVGELHQFSTIEDGLQFIIKKYGNEKLKPFIYNGSDNVTLLLDKNYLLLKDKFYFTHGHGGIEKYLQKYDITKTAEKFGLNIPKEELLNVGEIPSTLNYPVFTKATTSSNGGTWKDQAFICHNEDELKKAYSKIKSSKILVQEYIEKKNELCIDGISINGGEQVYMPYACHYYRFKEDSYGNYMYFFPFSDSELIEKIKSVIKAAQFTGIFCIEFLVDQKNDNYFLEVNFRNSGWSYAFTYGGFNLPVRWAISTIENNLYLNDFKPLQHFNAMAEFSDFRDFVLKKKTLSFKQWLTEFRNCECCFIHNKKDMAPFYSELFQILRRKIHL